MFSRTMSIFHDVHNVICPLQIVHQLSTVPVASATLLSTQSSRMMGAGPWQSGCLVTGIST